MASRKRRIGVGLGSALALLAVVGQANADVGATSGVSVAGNGLTVYASGSWFWPDPTTTRDTKYVGYAIDWGDVASGNSLGSYHLGDGTAATNVVLQPTTPDRGSHGTFGPVAHTYAAAGTYTVCALVYDLGSVQPIKATGWHSLRASGPDRNKDNSVDQQSAPPVSCATVKVTSGALASAGPASPTPVQSVAGATFVPGGSTPPPTATEGPSSLDGGAGLLRPVGLLLLSALGGVLVLGPRRRRG